MDNNEDLKKPMTATERKHKQREGYRTRGLVPKEAWIHPSRSAEFAKLLARCQKPAKH